MKNSKFFSLFIFSMLFLSTHSLQAKPDHPKDLILVCIQDCKYGPNEKSIKSFSYRIVTDIYSDVTFRGEPSPDAGLSLEVVRKATLLGETLLSTEERDSTGFKKLGFFNWFGEFEVNDGQGLCSSYLRPDIGRYTYEIRCDYQGQPELSGIVVRTQRDPPANN